MVERLLAKQKVAGSNPVFRSTKRQGEGPAFFSKRKVFLKNKGEPFGSPLKEVPGTHLLSHGVAPALPSAQDGLTAGFGMVPGVSRPSICTRDHSCSLKTA